MRPNFDRCTMLHDLLSYRVSILFWKPWNLDQAVVYMQIMWKSKIIDFNPQKMAFDVFLNDNMFAGDWSLDPVCFVGKLQALPDGR